MPSRSAVLRLLTGLAVIAAILLLTLVAWWSTLPLRDAVIERAHRETQLEVLANSYSNVFLLTGALTALAAVGGLFLRSGPVPKTGGPAVMGE